MGASGADERKKHEHVKGGSNVGTGASAEERKKKTPKRPRDREPAERSSAVGGGTTIMLAAGKGTTLLLRAENRGEIAAAGERSSRSG